MRLLYRETYYVCGDYLISHIYPVFKMQTSRGKKAKPTSETQQKLNEMKAKDHILRKANASFVHGYDIKLDLTFKRNPVDYDEAWNTLRNFLRRVKRFRAKKGLPDLKYIAVIETGSLKGRYHAHLIISGGLTNEELEKLWGYGYISASPLRFDENGLAGIVNYMMKQGRSMPGRKKYLCSNNLIDPNKRQRDGFLSNYKVKELGDPENRADFEKLHPGYCLSESKTLFNDSTGGLYLYTTYYNKEAAFCKKKTSNRLLYSDGRSSPKGSSLSSH